VPLVLALIAVSLTGAPAGAVARPDLARVVTQELPSGECISRVTIQRVDGRKRFVPAQGFDLSPGRHTMTGTVALDLRGCALPEAGNVSRAVPPLEADFEAGKTYYIGFDHSAEDSAEWRLVIWKTE